MTSGTAVPTFAATSITSTLAVLRRRRGCRQRFVIAGVKYDPHAFRRQRCGAALAESFPAGAIEGPITDQTAVSQCDAIEFVTQYPA